MTHQIENHKRWQALLLCLGVLMIVLDTTIVNVALPSIRADFGLSETALVWVVNAALLNGGYQPAFALGALFAAVAPVLGGTLLRPTPLPAGQAAETVHA